MCTTYTQIESLGLSLPPSQTIGSASVPLSDSVKDLVLHLIVTWPWKLTSPIWYAQPVGNSAALLSSVIFCLRMLQKILFLPLFFHALCTAFLSSLLYCFCLCSFTPCLLHFFPLCKYLLNKLQKVQNNAVGLIRTVPNTDHISPHLLLSTGCPLIHEYSSFVRSVFA